MTTTVRPRRPSDTRRRTGHPHPRSRRPQRSPHTHVVDRGQAFSAARLRRRIGLLVVVMALAFSAVVVRLVFVQGLSSAKYATFGAAQRLSTVTIPAERGSIFDRNHVELAMTIRQRTVWANPQLIRDPVADAHALAPVLHMDENALIDKLRSPGGFVYLARKVDDPTADKVASLKIEGINLLEEPKRFEPSGDLAASVIGQVGLDNQGLSGLELKYENQLQGRPGEEVLEHDPSGKQIATGLKEIKKSARGRDLTLTVDRSMQYETERALAQQIVASNAKGGVAIVTDPRTGDILAMASLSAGQNGGPPVPSPSNNAVTTVYEPGSVNKAVTISGALEEGIVQPADTITVPDHITIGTANIHDDENHPTGSWTITDIVANSSNVGTDMIAQRLGKTRIDQYLRAYGLGVKTALHFPGESAGLLLDPKNWSGASIATVPIGQGVAVTPLQMLEVYNTIANGGMYVAPRLVSGAPTPAPRRVVSKKTAEQITAMLTQVVARGTGKAAHIDGYTVAGKTGTARKVADGGKGYKEGAYIATFAGFVPAENPQLSAIVVLDEPTPIYGGLVSAPAFAELARYGLRRFEIPPPSAATTVAVPQLSPTAAAADRDAGGGAAAPVTPRPGQPAPTAPSPPASPAAVTTVPTTIKPSPTPKR
ncbi:MAG: penicillin-binding protein 2 [Acidimicrobiia bacterium]|nr:penicillin-binding protein 2 [Acidimicrobiia bacterium]